MNSPSRPAKDESYRGPIRWLLATVVLAILMVVVAATLLRKPAATNPFDAPAPAVEPIR